jgi:hypothetical protein
MKNSFDNYWGIGSLIGGFIFFISFLAFSEGIKLFIDIERNTRLTENRLLK